jgi:pentatricopeptide repeat protein
VARADVRAPRPPGSLADARDDGATPIADYAMIGDTRSAALISRHGSIDWLCWPRFDCASFFGRILDRERGGFFEIQPAIAFEAKRRYVEETNVLETTFTTAAGVVRLTDLMPVMREEEKRNRMTPFRQLLRRVEVLEGAVPLVARFSPRPNYGRESPALRSRVRGVIFCETGPNVLHLRSDVELTISGSDAEARFTLRAGEQRWFALGFDERTPAVFANIGEEAKGELERTIAFWRDWSSQLTYEGPHRDAVLRSALVLKLLTYAPSGAIVAAPTTSLPEKIGGVRNWDYRFCWLRDASFTVAALDDCGFEIEGAAFVSWLLYSTRLTHPRLQMLYDVFGESRIAEQELEHLEGYAGSKPVRCGNAAHDQFQLDVYGEVLGAVEEHLERGGVVAQDHETPKDVGVLLRRLADTVVKRWREPDSGIWEKRSERRQHVHAKVMAWSALDSALRLVGPNAEWQRAKDEIHALVLERGFDVKRNTFVGELDGDELDASLLYIARVGFLERDDPRISGTIDAIRAELGRDELVYRYEMHTDDGLPPGEGAFLPCSFWLVEALAYAGRFDEAKDVFAKMLARGNDLGLFSEELDVESGALLGNFPQALTHIGLMNAALCLSEEGKTRPEPRRTPRAQ